MIGAHGEGLQKELVLGGTAIKVLRDSPCPVLVVQRDVEHPYRLVVVGTDFSENALRAYRASQNLFPEASHILVHAYSVLFEGRLRLAGATLDHIEHYAAEERERARRALAQRWGKATRISTQALIFDNVACRGVTP